MAQPSIDRVRAGKRWKYVVLHRSVLSIPICRGCRPGSAAVLRFAPVTQWRLERPPTAWFGASEFSSLEPPVRHLTRNPYRWPGYISIFAFFVVCIAATTAAASSGVVYQTSVDHQADEDLASPCLYEITLTDPSRAIRGV